MPRRPSPAPSVLQGADDGLSLIEVIVAITLFALVSGATATMLLTGIGVSRDARNRTAAAQAATESLELARKTATTSFTQLTNPSVPVVRTINSVPFTITQTAVFIPKGAVATSCSATSQGGNASVQPVLLVTETVTWPRMDRTAPVTVATTLTPPIGAYPSGTGGVDVKVVDSKGMPVAGVSITLTGATPTSMTTNAAGCAYAAFLTPGNYTVSANVPGYVDNQEQMIPSQIAGVVNGQPVSLTFYYDLSATIAAVLDITVAPATGLPVTLGNSGLAGTGSYAFAPGVTTLTPVYPYSSYGIWAGRCPEAYPAAVDAGSNPLYSPATVKAVTPVTGASVAVTVPLYRLRVSVVTTGKNGKGGGIPINGAGLTALETGGTAKTLCGAPYNTYGLTTSKNVSGIDGVSETGLPLGTFQITVTSGVKSATQLVTVRPAGASITVAL